MAYRRWLSTLAFEHPAQQIAFQDYVDAVMDAERRLQRVEEQISVYFRMNLRQLLMPCTSFLYIFNHLFNIIL